jgi:thiamine kinase-like enzyme
MNRQLERSIANDFLLTQETRARRITLLKGGLIHKSFLIETMNDHYFVLQAVNTQVFQNPGLLVVNQEKISLFLRQKHYPKACLQLITNSDGELLVKDEKGQIWRFFKAIYPSKNIDVITGETQAFEAAKSLSEFHAFLIDFPKEQLQECIPGFLDFNKRWKNYKHSVKVAIPYRHTQAKSIIERLDKHQTILKKYAAILPKLPLRIIHADPKLSNFLFDMKGKEILALIDWDTIMVGNILYDIGDMIRSFCQIGSEDQPQKKYFHVGVLKEILKGYVHGPMNDHLTDVERENILLGAKAVIFVQALRFLSDYLIGDQYYWVEHEDHNLRRATNQLMMLEELIELESD